uniref:RteC protein n=1 Tax=Strongyloides venezuelensis TaxID=75913 RepID=A0A0K0FTF0_STRVS
MPELCQIKLIERERKKLYFFDSIRVLQGIGNIKKYYKELNKSQFRENYSIEKIINDIFIYYDHDLPIISWNNIEQKTNGLVWRELPFKRYALFLGTTFLSEFDTLEEGIILWVQLNQLCKDLKLFGINKTLYHLLLLKSDVPMSKVPKPRGRLCKIAHKIYNEIKNISIK